MEDNYKLARFWAHHVAPEAPDLPETRAVLAVTLAYPDLREMAAKRLRNRELKAWLLRDWTALQAVAMPSLHEEFAQLSTGFEQALSSIAKSGMLPRDADLTPQERRILELLLQLDAKALSP